MDAFVFFVNLFSGPARSMCFVSLCVTAVYDAVQLITAWTTGRLPNGITSLVAVVPVLITSNFVHPKVGISRAGLWGGSAGHLPGTPICNVR